MKKTQKLLAFVAVICMGVFSTTHVVKVHADNLTANLTISPGCISSINGATSQSIDVVAGSSTLTINNNNGIVGHAISGPGVAAGTVAERASRETNNITTVTLSNLTTPTTITFTPIPTDYTNPGISYNYCPLGSTPSASYLVINPIANQAPAPVASTPTPKKQTATTTTPTTTSPALDTKTTTTTTAKDAKKKTLAILDQDNTIEETSSPYRKTILASVIALTILASCLGLVYFVRTHPKYSFSRMLKRSLKRR